MPKKMPLMRLSRAEEVFLRHWMYDEAHYRDGLGPAKRLQLQHRATSADLAALVAAAMPDAMDQEEAGLGPPPAGPPTWPWSEGALQIRISEAHTTLAYAAPESEFDARPKPRSRPIHRGFLVVTAAIGILVAAQVLLPGGYACSFYRVQVRGLVIDPAGRPLRGAEVFVIRGSPEADDELLAHLKSCASPDEPSASREVRFATTDAQGRFTMALEITKCRRLGLFESIRRAFEDSKPTPSSYSLVVQCEGFRRQGARINAGRWIAERTGPGDPWIYEVPPLGLVAR